MDYFTIAFRTIFFYFFILLAFRIMGKREVGQLGLIDLVVLILIAELVAINIENLNDSIFRTIIPIVILVILQVSLAYSSIKSKKLRNLVGGKPSIIIYNGRLNYHEMVKQRYCMDDLLLHLRQEKIKSIEDIEYAFLEANGKLSIFKYNFFKFKGNYPMPLILDGTLQKRSLGYIKKSENWLRTEIAKKGVALEDVFYAFYKKTGLYIIKRSDLI